MSETAMLLSRRRALQALAVLVSTPAGLPWAAADTLADRQLLAAQILNGVTPASLSVVDELFAELMRELGQDTVTRLITAVLQRDASSITRPFEDAAIEQAAQRALDLFYSGEIKGADGQADALYFHQALTWQVLDFTKPPSICGPGFGWWADKPDSLA